ncbi:ATP-binding protein [Nonomuraea polychroma]|nr:AAA family ATPase [Nonomuraea polychroma]
MPRTRLLTLTGPGGVGKTRLALHAAHALRSRFRDGVAVVEVHPLTHDDLLAPAVAAALGARDLHRPVRPQLAEHLADKRMLLVLDGCEHLVQACAELTQWLLGTAPRVRVMTTSRHRLGVIGEQVLEIGPLPYADQHAPVREIARSDAVRLLIERAVTAQVGLRVDAATIPVLARICRRLDGIPLAIELAAARLRACPLEQLERELEDDGTGLAGHSSSPSADFHDSLRATIDWSYRLCSPAERRLWGRLSLFPGGVDLETAEEVCSGAGIAVEDIVDVIAALVDHSILSARPSATGMRYWLLDTLRAYGGQCLTSHDEELLRERYCAHYRSLAERQSIDRLSPDQLESFRILQIELPNVRTALKFFYSSPASAEGGLNMAARLGAFWLLAGALTEGRHWLDHGLDLVPARTRTRITALWVDALLAIYQRDPAAATAWLGQCHVLAEELEDETGRTYAAMTDGIAELAAGNTGHGLALMEAARARQRAAGDLDAVGLNLYLAATFCAADDPDTAEALGRELLALCEVHGAPLFRAYALFLIGVAAWKHGDSRQTERLVQQATAPWMAVNDHWGLAKALEVLAWTAEARHAHERAARLLGAAEALWQEIGFAPTLLPYHTHSHQDCERGARQALGQRAFAAAFRRGAELDLHTAVAYAISNDDRQ